MRRNLRLTLLLTAALALPISAATAQASGAPMAMLDDHELTLPAPVTMEQAAADAFDAAIQTTATDRSGFALGELEPTAPAELQFAALSEDELGAQRGGFMTPLGVEVGFGAIIRTTIDGALALETKMTWTENGAETSQSFGAPMSASTAASISATGGINLGPASGWSGIVSPGDGGATAVMHDLSDHAISSLIVNTANNRVIKQDTEINLQIPDFAAFQAETLSDQLRLRLNDSMGAALAAGLPK